MKIDSFNSNKYEKELTKIKQFLLSCGFTTTTLDVLDSVAKLVLKSTHEISLIMTQEYAELAASKSSAETYRTKINYYIHKNYNKVHDYILETHNYDIGNFYSGVKNFIEQIAIVYSVLACN